ncbi:MAG: class I SAM-dependent methyltransferase [Caldilineaceae bacterium]
MSKFSQLYQKLYQTLCGRHPYLRPWHFQWLVSRPIYADLQRVLARQTGQVLDVGCGDGPYHRWLPITATVVGIDIYPGRGVNILSVPEQPWPLQSASFDTVLCTQVLEHVTNVDLLLQEIKRVLKPGGYLICTVPFIYNVHGAPHDYRRFSTYGLQQQLGAAYEIIELQGQGRIGSSLGTLLLNWLEQMFNHYRLTRFLKAALLPFWLLFCAGVNTGCLLLDQVDVTAAYYNNVLLVARKCV